jgi:hypothetical protein
MSDWTVPRPAWRAAFWAFVLAMLAVRVAAVFTANLNGDEFALLQRAEISARSGAVVGGGRPGLATLLLMPLAAGCRNALNALIQARLVWTGMVVASGVAFWFLLRAVLRPSKYRWTAQALGLALWVLAPAFLHSSTQVRTDQPAILAGLLGGRLLLASRHRPVWATLAGALFGLGFLFTQKLVYVAGLMGVLAGGQLLIDDDWKPRREILRATLTAAAFLVVVLGYRAVLQQVSAPPTVLPVSGALRTFTHYRETIGWVGYLLMLPTLVPQLTVVLFLPLAAVDWLRSRGRHGRPLAVGAAVLALGLGVLLFHAARFPYFYMVLGLFPATIGALVAVPVLERLPQRRNRITFLAVLWAPLVFFSFDQAAALLRDTQSIQRDSLAFVERNFPPEARGFNSLAAFACRRETDPFPVWVHEHVRARFGNEPDATENTRLLMQEHRDRPVAFMIPPLPWEPYPDELREFWETRYVHYHGAVHVAGRPITGGPGTTLTFDVFVPGAYVWLPSSGVAAPLTVAGHELDPGDVVVIDEPGVVPVHLPEGGNGMLVLALPDPPAPDPRPFFRSWIPL